jgi:hypothetical protein
MEFIEIKNKMKQLDKDIIAKISKLNTTQDEKSKLLQEFCLAYGQLFTLIDKL